MLQVKLQMIFISFICKRIFLKYANRFFGAYNRRRITICVERAISFALQNIAYRLSVLYAAKNEPKKFISFINGKILRPRFPFINTT